VSWLIWTPIIVLGVLLVLLLLLTLLARIRGGRYLMPIVRTLSKIGFMRRLFMRMQHSALERQNPELASAIKKIEAFGTPTTPEAAQRALARLSPAERRAYMEAAGDQVEMTDAPNRAARRNAGKIQPPAGSARPGAAGRKRRRR
jgi:hypothetical protein